MTNTETPSSTASVSAFDTGSLKRFATEARTELLKQIGVRVSTVLAEGSLARRENGAVVTQLETLIDDIGQQRVIEQVAYTWFNRFIALRYMDINRYTRIGIVSPIEDQIQPEILAEAKMGHLDDEMIPGTTRDQINAILDGTVTSSDPQGEVYRLLLVASCNYFATKLPFLFEAITDYTELLLPDDLLSVDSILTATREALTHETCSREHNPQHIEIIGWLYQFYISEKKDEVIGKVVKSEDIPAATQLFTPNWIVKYMVQNSLGAQWLATYPQSPLKGQMAYYIEPAEQTDEVNAQLAAITPSQLNPEALTLIDPASGSGHILVEAYELFKAIYLERGYRQRDVPQLILTQNLFGLDIDERAAQLTGFALMMKGRSDDRRLFERGVKLNVMALVDSADFDAEGLAKGVELGDYGLKPGDVTELKQLFEYATTFGSLIQVPEELAEKLPALKQVSEVPSQDLFVSETLKRLGPLVQQAELLASQYDAVVANPPYMGGKAMNALVKEFAKDHFPHSKSDLFSVSTERFMTLAKPSGFSGLMTPFTWMFLKSYEALRGLVLETKTLHSLIQPEYHAFFESAYVPVCTFIVQHCHTSGYDASFIKLSDFYGAELQPQKTLEAIANRDCGWIYRAKPDEFKTIPGSPVAYWASDGLMDAFSIGTPIGSIVNLKVGLQTGDNDRFLRKWHEVDHSAVGFGFRDSDEALGARCRWLPYCKGGEFRKWYGNNEYLVRWDKNGEEIKALIPKSVIRNESFYFRPSITWSALSSSSVSMRKNGAGFLFDTKGQCLFADDEDTLMIMMALLNSAVVKKALELLAPTLDFNAGTISKIPLLPTVSSTRVAELSRDASQMEKRDWDAYERSWDFQSLPLLTASSDPTPTLESSYTAWITQNKGTIAEMKRLEEENNRLFIDAYGLADELTPDVPIEQITLTVNPAYRYGGKLTEEEQWTRFRQDTMEELVSYAIGCMMGRYSLDAPGLIYAHSGNEGFDPDKYTTFPADDDNVIPIVDGEWFSDDIVARCKEFLKVVWGTENYEQNLRWLEDGLYPKNATAKTRKTLRDYFLKDFYKSHISTYKKRPIYWMFSSPKGTFNALIYLHRYRPDTVSVILNDYLREFNAKLTAKLESLQHLADSGDAGKTEKVAALKEITLIKKQLTELEDYERDVLFPLAQQQIEIDLDDGVLTNYNKFGTALKKVTGLTGKNKK